MQIAIDERGQVTILTVDGSLDSLTAQELEVQVKKMIEEGRVSLVMDLSGVDYSSSAGLKVLLAARKLSRQMNGDLRLANVQDSVEKIFRMAGLFGVIPQYPDLEAAVESFGEHR
jgi:anti-sigma B factor antagonist